MQVGLLCKVFLYTHTRIIRLTLFEFRRVQLWSIISYKILFEPICWQPTRVSLSLFSTDRYLLALNG